MADLALPIGGLPIGYGYYYGQRCSKGNNLLLEEYENPQKIPLTMALWYFLAP
jgi:hypothetical protein